MKILITGGAGFIGSNFVYYELAHHDDELYVLDLLTYAGNLANLDRCKDDPRLHFIKGDICDKGFIDALFEKEHFDLVVNFAAESHVDRSIDDPGIFLKTNIIGVQVLMDACLKYDIKRFHQISTDEVYGELPLDRKDLTFHEDNPLKPSSPYSTSKAAADLLVMAYHRTYGLNMTISRCSNNYGPYQFPEKLIPLMINNARHDRPLPVYGQGLNVRDWIYVEDHCAGVDLIMRHGQNGQIYNIGGHNEKPNIEVVKTILKALDKPETLITYVKDRPGHDLRYAIDPTKIQNELHWQAAYPFDNGLKKTIDWYLTNESWLEAITSGAYMEYYQHHYGDYHN